MKQLLTGAAFAAIALCTVSFVPSTAIAQTGSAPSVTASIGVDHKIACCSPASDEDVVVLAGDSVTVTAKFSRDIGLFDPASMPRVSGDVLTMEQHLQRIDADTIQVAKFRTLKVGTAAIEMVNFKGDVVRTIHVKVQPRFDAGN
jgi:hypothetical protein